MKILKLLLISLIFGTLHANNIEKYLQKCENKSDCHGIKNIDFIYLINLDRRPDRLIEAKNKLDKYNIYPYRFSAMDGSKLSFECLNDVAVKFERGMKPIMATTYVKNCDGDSLIKAIHENAQVGKSYFIHAFAKGGIGCTLSHISILQDALNSGYNRIWIMEDDIEFMKDPNIISERVEQLDALVGKNGWDLLYTDKEKLKEFSEETDEAIPREVDKSCVYMHRFNFIPNDLTRAAFTKNISSEFRQVGARFGNHSIIINKPGIIKILNFFKTYHIFGPIDLEYPLTPDIRLFTVTNDITSTLRVNISNVGG